MLLSITATTESITTAAVEKLEKRSRSKDLIVALLAVFFSVVMIIMIVLLVRYIFWGPWNAF